MKVYKIHILIINKYHWKDIVKSLYEMSSKGTQTRKNQPVITPMAHLLSKTLHIAPFKRRLL